MKWVLHIGVLGSACFFAVMWGLVLQEQVGAPPTLQIQPDYDTLLAPEMLRRETIMGIYLGKKRLGVTKTVVERTVAGGVTIHSSTTVKLADLSKLIGLSAGTFTVDFFADVSPLSGLENMRVFCGDLGVRLLGSVQNGVLSVTGTVGKQRVEMEFPYAESPFFGEALSPITGLPDMSRLSVGDSWMLHLVNPILGSVQKVRVKVEGIVEKDYRGEKTRFYRLVFHVRSKAWYSWVTADGDVMIQGTPFGVTLRREDVPHKLLAELDAASKRKGWRGR